MNIESRQLPPQNLEAEMSVIGSILVDNDAIDRVMDHLTPDDFYRESHRKILKAIIELNERKEPFDFITMTDTLKKSGELEAVGGAGYLLTLVDYVPTAANVVYYCKMVSDLALKRRLLISTQTASRMLYESDSVTEVIVYLESAITQLPMMKQATEPVEIKQALRETVKTIKSRYESKGKVQGIPYGVTRLDKATNGMQRGDLIIIAGRPSMGKSALAGNVIESACVSGLSVLLFSLEMSRELVTERMISSLGKINYSQIRSGMLSDDEWPKLSRVSNDIHNWSFHIDDTPGITFHQIRSKAKRLKRKGLDLVVIDYLQLIGINGKENRTHAIGEISRGLKKMARELDIPVVALSQLSRSVDSRPDKRPVMSDLRDSGEIEQDSDVILFPYRESVYCGKCRDRVNNDDHTIRDHEAKAEIIIEKQRNGLRNISIPVVWLGPFQRFEGFNGK